MVERSKSSILLLCTASLPRGAQEAIVDEAEAIIAPCNEFSFYAVHINGRVWGAPQKS